MADSLVTAGWQVGSVGWTCADRTGGLRVRGTLRVYYGLRALYRELMKFGVVGAVAFVVDVGVFNFVRLVIELGPLTSKTVSVVLATTVAYVGNRAWTFRHRDRRGLRREYTLFFAFNAIGLLIALLCLGLSFYVLGLQSTLAQNVAANGVGLLLATAFRFWSYRRFVFPEAVAIVLTDDSAAPANGAGGARSDGAGALVNQTQAAQGRRAG